MASNNDPAQGFHTLKSGPDNVCRCSACQCNPAGSVDLQCDVATGACSCKPNIAGLNCDQCEENKYNLEAGCLGLKLRNFALL